MGPVLESAVGRGSAPPDVLCFAAAALAELEDAAARAAPVRAGRERGLLA